MRAAAPAHAGSWFSSQSLRLIQVQISYHNRAFKLDNHFWDIIIKPESLRE